MEGTIAAALLINAAVLAVFTLIFWAIAVKIDDVSFIDALWGAGMAVMAAASWLQILIAGLPRTFPDDFAASMELFPGSLANLIAVMAVLWGLRLGVYLFRRWRHEGEDPRYKRILKKDREAGHFARAALVKVFGMQAILLFIACLPAQLGVLGAGAARAAEGAHIGMLAQMGALLWLIGMVFETVGDWQLAKFKADPDNKGKVLDSGLWRYTRHPNYFGDCCVWWGIWLAAASLGPMIAMLSVIGPIFVTYTLTRWSGKPLLEKGMQKTRPQYAQYKARTSGFFPLPPKKETE